MSRVVISENENIDVAVKSALKHLKLKPLIKNKVVAIKTNDTWASEKDKTAITQPDTLRSVIRLVQTLEPQELIVTGGSGAAETDEVFEISGLMDVVRQEGVEFFDHNRPPFTLVELSYARDKEVSGPQKSVMVNPRVREYETLIVLSQLKLHATATVTLGLKNLAMSYPAADYYGHPRSQQKNPHHFFEDMHSFIAAMVNRFPIDLSIITGHPAMVATGPIGGYTAETGLVIASLDALAADVVGARLLGFNVQGVRHLWEAKKMGLGESDFSNMEFPGLSLNKAYKTFTKKVYGIPLTLNDD